MVPWFALTPERVRSLDLAAVDGNRAIRCVAGAHLRYSHKWTRASVLHFGERGVDNIPCFVKVRGCMANGFDPRLDPLERFPLRRRGRKPLYAEARSQHRAGCRARALAPPLLPSSSARSSRRCVRPNSQALRHPGRGCGDGRGILPAHSRQRRRAPPCAWTAGQ
jgi:hypothetical protein